MWTRFSSTSVDFCHSARNRDGRDRSELSGSLIRTRPLRSRNSAFLIGRWRCEATITLANGKYDKKYEAAWIGRYILDGYVIADEYGMAIPAGETIVLGMNFRAYDASRREWNIKWLNALTGTWIDLGPEELGGVRFERMITCSAPSAALLCQS